MDSRVPGNSAFRAMRHDALKCLVLLQQKSLQHVKKMTKKMKGSVNEVEKWQNHRYKEKKQHWVMLER